jgi:DNA-binding SARP family transcriptional activator/Tfp pilus assembly protein PilF
VEFRVLGEVDLVINGRSRSPGSPKVRCVLAILLLAAGQPVPVDVLEGRLWGDHPPKEARATLHSYVCRLRRRLREAASEQAQLTLGVGGYRLEVEAERVDLFKFDRLCHNARKLADAGDEERAVALLREALSLWRGEGLAGLPGDWAAAARSHIAERHLAATLNRIELELSLGRHAGLIGELSELAATRPINEVIIKYLMIALNNSGRQGEALEAFQRVRDRLVEETGRDPGRDLQEIQQRILRDDPSLAPAQPSRRKGAAGLPDTLLADVRDFTGREREVRSLMAECDDQSMETAVVIEAIHGMPGVGKTALAMHVAHQLRDRYRDGRFYLRLRAHDATQAPLDPSSALASLLNSLGVAGDRLPSSLDERASLWRSMIAGRRVLLILDDSASTEQVTPLLPGTAGSLVLITSRHRLTGFGETAVISLDVLNRDDAVALFTRIAGSDRCKDADLVARAVLLCGYLPLAIRLAASQFRDRSSWSINHFVERLARIREAEYPGGEITRDLFSFFELSYQGLDDNQRQLFRRLGLHQGIDFSPQAAAALNGTPLADTENLLDSLVDRHLLDEPKRHRYRFHDLVRDYARHIARRDEGEEGCRLAVHRALDYYLLAADQADRVNNPLRRRIPIVITHRPPATPALASCREAKEWLDAERSNLLSVTELALTQQWLTHAALLPYVLAPVLGLWGRWEHAARYHRGAAEIWRDSDNHSGQAQALAELSAALWRIGMYQDANRTAAQALEIYRWLGDQRGEADTLILVGLVSFGSGNFHKAQEHFRRALVIRQAIGDERGEAKALNYIAIARNHMGNYNAVLADLDLALRISRRIEDRHCEYMTLNNIGEVQQHLGHFDAALQNYQASLKIQQEAGSRQDQAVILNNLGEICRRTGQYQHALEYFGRAVDLYQETKDRRGEADSLINIAYTVQHGGRAAESMAYFRRALEIAHWIGDRYEQARSLIGIGAAQHDLGDHDAALGSYRRGLDLAREIASPREEAQALEGIGTTKFTLAGASEAHVWWMQALARYEQLGLPEADALRNRLRDTGGSDP